MWRPQAAAAGGRQGISADLGTLGTEQAQAKTKAQAEAQAKAKAEEEAQEEAQAKAKAQAQEEAQVEARATATAKAKLTLLLRAKATASAAAAAAAAAKPDPAPSCRASFVFNGVVHPLRRNLCSAPPAAKKPKPKPKLLALDRGKAEREGIRNAPAALPPANKSARGAAACAAAARLSHPWRPAPPGGFQPRWVSTCRCTHT